MPTMVLAWEGSRPDNTTCAPGATSLRTGTASLVSGPIRMLANIRSYGPRGANGLRADTGSTNEGDHRCRVVQPGVGSSSVHGDWVDVSGGNTCPQQSCRPDCKHACAGADVERVERAPAFRQLIEREETAAGRPMVTGAEGEGGLDLDSDVVCSQIGTVMCAMNDEASGTHGLQPGKALRHPIAGGDPLDAERVCRGFAGRELDQVAQPAFVRRIAEMNRHLPASGIVFEGGAGGIHGVEAFAKKSCKTAGGRFVARKTGDSGGRIHATQDCPSHSRAQWLCTPL